MLGGSRRTALIALAVAVAAACLVTPFCLRRTTRFYSDGSTRREAVEDARPALREVLWQPASPVPGSINRPDTDEYEPRVSPDGRLLAFTRGRPGGHADLWIAERRAAGWGEPEPLRAINSPHDDMGACFALAGPGSTRLVIYFYSDRPGGEGGYDLWATLSDGEDGWGTPFNLGPQVNSPFSEFSPSASADSRLLLFATNRLTGGSPEPPRWTATVRETLEVPDYDIYSSGRLAGTRIEFGEAAIVESLSSPKWTEGAIAISPHDDFVYFASNRAAGHGGFDLYRARLGGGVVGPVENLGPRINTAGHELDPALSASGFELYFARRAEGQSTEDIYVSLSREVFLETEAGETYWSSSAVLSFLRDVLRSTDPTILALVLSSLVCLIFAAVFGRKLSRLALLTRCFLVALLVHLVIALWMNSTQVHRVLMGTLGEEEQLDSFQVAVDSAAEEDVAYSIRNQIAETGGDAPPSMDAGSIASRPVLAPREYAVTPRMLEPGSPDPAAGALARTSMAAAVRPPPGASSLPAPALDLASVGGGDEPELPPEEKLVAPAVALLQRDAAPPDVRVEQARPVELTTRVNQELPPADDVRPLPVSLHADVAPESLNFDGRTNVPPPGAPGPLLTAREGPDFVAPAGMARVLDGDLTARVVASRSLPAPERAAVPMPSELRLERSANRSDTRVTSAHALGPAGVDARPEGDLLSLFSRAVQGEIPRDAAETRDAVSAVLPGAPEDGTTPSAPSSPRPVAPEAPPDRLARGTVSSLDVAPSPASARRASTGNASTSVLSPLAPQVDDVVRENARMDAPTVALRRERVERTEMPDGVLPPVSPVPGASRAVATGRPLAAEAAPAPASAGGPELVLERHAVASHASITSSEVLTPVATPERPTMELAGATRVLPARSGRRESGAAPDRAPLTPLPDAGTLASVPLAPRHSAPEAAAARAQDGMPSALAIAASTRARRLEPPRGESASVLQPTRAQAEDVAPSSVAPGSPKPVPSHEDAEKLPDSAAAPPLGMPGGEAGAPVAALRAVHGVAESAPRPSSSPELSLQRTFGKMEPDLAVARVLAPLALGPRPGDRLPRAARVAPGRFDAGAAAVEVAALPVSPPADASPRAPSFTQSSSAGGERLSRPAEARLEVTASAVPGRAALQTGNAPLRSPQLVLPEAREPRADPSPVSPLPPRSRERMVREQTEKAAGDVAMLTPPPSPDADLGSKAFHAAIAPARPSAKGPASAPGEQLAVTRQATEAPAPAIIAPRVAAGPFIHSIDGDRSAARSLVPRGAPPSSPEPRIERVESTPLLAAPARAEEPAPVLAPPGEGQRPGQPSTLAAAGSSLALASAISPAARGNIASGILPEVTQPGTVRGTAPPEAPSASSVPPAAALAAPRGGPVTRAASDDVAAVLPGAAPTPEESSRRVVSDRAESPPASPPPRVEPSLPDIARAEPQPAVARLEVASPASPASLALQNAADLRPSRGPMRLPRAPEAPLAPALDGAADAKSGGEDAPRLLPRPRELEVVVVSLEGGASRPQTTPDPRRPSLQSPIHVTGLLPSTRRTELQDATRPDVVLTLRPAPAAPDPTLRGSPPAPRTEPSRSAALALGDTRAVARRNAEPGSLQPVQATSSFVPRIYQLRAKTRREEATRLGGGSAETEHAVDLGLKWLALHQSPDGRWSLRDYMRHLPEVSERDRWHPDWDGHGRNDSRGGTSRAENGDTGATGLALLAFLGHGDTQIEAGPYQDNVKRAFRFLLSHEQRDGDLRGGGNLYMHALAAFAICEALALTRDPELEKPARRAIGFTLRSQNPDLGGWRYEPYPQGKDVDTSVFGWMLMAIKSARLAGIDVEPRALSRMSKYLDSARVTRGGGRYAYQPGLPRSSVAMTAQGFFCQQILSELLPTESETEKIKLRRAANESVSILLQNRPEAVDQDGANYYYWYYATLALFQEEGVAWETWNTRMKQVLLKLQLGEENGTAEGSWDPLDRRAALGGRVYSTAISILSLEVYYRYAPKGK